MENGYVKKNEKKIFWMVVFCCFLAIFLFNVLTPVMSDDYSYSVTVRSIHSVGDLLKSEYEQYMSWTGRSVNHLILRYNLKKRFYGKQEPAIIFGEQPIYWDLLLYLSMPAGNGKT